MRAAHEAKMARYRDRLLARLKGMTPLAIWNLAYQRGYNAAWLRQRRRDAA